MRAMADIVPEIEQRRAKRALSTQTVPPETIERIMDAAVLAPSCANNQPWRFVVVNEEPALSQVKAALSDGNYWAKQAPLIIVVCTQEELDCRPTDGRKYALFDTGLAAGNCILQAVREGLIAHPIAGFTPDAVRRACGIPNEVTVITLIIVGLPGDTTPLSQKHILAESAARVRLPRDRVVMFNSWSVPDSGPIA
jgi:nitroreductase